MDDGGEWPPVRPQGSPLWLHPDDDLAPNRPGETLRGAGEAAPGGLRRGLDRLLGRAAAAAARRDRLTGEMVLGAALDGLAPGGWRTLHSILLPGHEILAHLAIGPGGVFGFYTACHPRARLWAGSDAAAPAGSPDGPGDGPPELVRIGRRREEPYLRFARRLARRAALALSAGCGTPVPVAPVLALVAAGEVRVSPELRDVEVVREDDIRVFGGRGGVLKPETVETLYGVARDRRTWLRA
ncbi:hypothetical protein [Streptomyces aidingensis]|uniref:Nuclease-related domain-containing protein n=1 Tax=Streptomyces aidingensis TaxID=910347 RepID=A0A1I1P957_9ACTN|nr:hypothetical protein [Streptomyces aidingensis]SFD06367.1 hypothetical protein SAMN05421773_10948 [Streptomyces aidingensis]